MSNIDDAGTSWCGVAIEMPKREAALNAINFFLLAIYLVLGAITFYMFVEPSLNGTNGWRVYADSVVYMDVADFIRDQGFIGAVASLLSFARNLILPGLVALTLRTEAHIAIFNVALFFIALGILARTYSRFKWYVFLPIILASPTTYEALFTLNKEIFVFLSAAIMARWFRTKSVILIFLLITLSVALRWEQALVILSFVSLIRMKVSPKLAAAVLIVGISIGYPFAIAAVSAGIPEDASSPALYAQINILQSYGLYFALFIPKMAIAMLSQVIRFWTPFVDPVRLHDLPTGPFVLVDQICMCFVAIASWFKGIWVMENPVVYFVLVYCLVYLAAPENQPRYFYMIYVLMAAVLSSQELQLLRISPKADRPNH
jgi:hypothetical protein